MNRDTREGAYTAMDQARRKAGVSKMTPARICVDGRQVGGRHVMYVDGEPVLVSRSPMRIMVYLAIFRATDENDGWVEIPVLSGSDRCQAQQNAFILRRQIHEAYDQLRSWPVFETRREAGPRRRGQFLPKSKVNPEKISPGAYRLLIQPETITFRPTGITSLNYSDLNELIARHIANGLA